MTPERRAVLFTAPGTTCPEAAATFAEIGSAAGKRLPGVELHWAYTSSPIRQKLAAQGCPVPSPAEALTALNQDGLAHVAVISLHMTDGMEFGELASVVRGFGRQRAGAMRVALGHPLMSRAADWERAMKVVLSTLPESVDPGDRIVLVAHGSRDAQALKTLEAAAATCKRIDPRLTLGMMLGTPGLDETIAACRAAAASRVWLVPCTAVAGYSARNEIAGPGEKSWRAAFERAGIACTPIVKGLGEYAGVIDIWLDQAESLLDELAG